MSPTDLAPRTGKVHELAGALPLEASRPVLKVTDLEVRYGKTIAASGVSRHRIEEMYERFPILKTRRRQ